ncbi:tRNA-splicing endonuclease subunit sen54 [Exophiala xenobiotica]|uniref:tRNA-splicing endonuclease subunit sen54 n=1 Tax=Lithohypha guttulata TaxID=1690604 RepID=A0ABR0KFD9_9EURO|nr:tRNA-splicing endonuclease subunit sen54 [Lithohypha guttulata]KAK5314451.1 tRNA-splicing endonuclease subunit sen54 [Exophiala xenobiotica]
MADADEDLIPLLDPSQRSRPSLHADADGDVSDSDADSDAAPDYRFLTTANAKKHALPARGTKDFEPNPTQKQASTLDASRKAMSDALSVLRVHSTRKNENIAVYFPGPEDWDGQRYEEQALLQVEDLDKREKMRQSSVLKSGEGRTMGQHDRRNWLWLLPEEALFLLERGSLDIRYAIDEEDEANNADVEGSQDAAVIGDEVYQDPDTPRLDIGKVPMSLQGAYAAFIGKSGLTLERYIVFTNLRRAGYIVQRAPTWHGRVDDEFVQSNHVGTLALGTRPFEPEQTHPTLLPSASLIYRLVHWLLSTPHKPSTVPYHNSVTGPLISPGLFRNYGDIFRQLHLIPYYQYNTGHPTPQTDTRDLADSDSDPSRSRTEATGSDDDQPLLPTYHVNKPSSLQGYKKSAPPPPHYTVVVLDARNSTVPTSSQIGNLLTLMPDDPLPDADKKRLETRIKHGTKSVLLAVVDSGLVSYMRISSGGFSPGNILWEENEKRGKMRGGAKRGGGRRGRGRGRGRGGSSRGG